MRSTRLAVLISLAGCLLGSSVAGAQEKTGAATSGAQSRAPLAARSHHPFWDTPNAALFGGVAASRVLDYASTRHFRALGLNEWLLTNELVDNKPLFQAIEVTGIAVSVGMSYLFHRTNHHNLERWASVVHVGVTVAGAAHNYTLNKPPTRGAAR
jgi:hypothetical protein